MIGPCYSPLSLSPHSEASTKEHAWKAWGKATEMEKMVAEQGKTIATLERRTEGQKSAIESLMQTMEDLKEGGTWAGAMKMQFDMITMLVKRDAEALNSGEALTRVFTWSTDGSWKHNGSSPYTFTD
ncbi:hypothetical protein T484DRAFT_1901430 [Baffinella frigidus]|nr:hypothetical protein T484DRAFT_1901430 [Cryptophyta sp. CCMP2293]